MARLRTLRNRLWDGVKDMEEVYLNGDLEQGAPNILNVSFNYVEGESLIMALKDRRFFRLCLYLCKHGAILRAARAGYD